MEEQALVPVDQGVIYGGEKINFSCWLTWKPICQLTPQPLAGICGFVFLAQTLAFWPSLSIKFMFEQEAPAETD